MCQCFAESWLIGHSIKNPFNPKSNHNHLHLINFPANDNVAIIILNLCLFSVVFCSSLAGLSNEISIHIKTTMGKPTQYEIEDGENTQVERH